MKRSEIKRRPLSDTALASIKPETREYRELDGSGLYLRVKPDGQKSWQLRYKNQAGKWSWLGLGGYPEVSGALARKKAAEYRKEIANGGDPIAARKARKAAELEAATNTFEILAREWIESSEEARRLGEVLFSFIDQASTALSTEDDAIWQSLAVVPRDDFTTGEQELKNLIYRTRRRSELNSMMEKQAQTQAS